MSIHLLEHVDSVSPKLFGEVVNKTDNSEKGGAN